MERRDAAPAGTGRTVIAIGIGAALFFAASAAHAWAVKSYYPTALSPTMPDKEQAIRIRSESPTLLRALRSAHRDSLQRSWTGTTAPSTDPRLTASIGPAVDDH